MSLPLDSLLQVAAAQRGERLFLNSMIQVPISGLLFKSQTDGF